MNRVWTVDRQPDRLAEFFHRDMVAVTPTDRHRIEGRQACVAGWKGFATPGAAQLPQAIVQLPDFSTFGCDQVG